MVAGLKIPTLAGVNMDTRTMIVSGAYIISGLRMGMGGIALAIKGHLNNELPRFICFVLNVYLL